VIRRPLITLALLGALGCGDSSVAPPQETPPVLLEAVDGVKISMDFESEDFYAAPFPSAHRPHTEMTRFPNPDDIDFVTRSALLAAEGKDGFGTTSGVFFQLQGEISKTNLPSIHDTVLPDSPVALISITDCADDYGRRYPVSVDFRADPGPHGAPNMLSMVPVQGIPLAPWTTYAAIVTRDLTSDARLGVPLSMVQLNNSVVPNGLTGAAAERYQEAMERLKELGIGDLAAMTVFTTGSPTRGLAEAVDQVQVGAIETPKVNGPFEASDQFDDYCVYQTTIEMPIFQDGEPPFSVDGGGWTWDADGQLISQGFETARIVVTVPRKPLPAGGWPLVNFIRKGGGGDRPLVDRGVHAEPHGPTIEPGSGPARTFAAAGWAGISVDGPHGGLRNITQSDEQFLMFNVTNPLALRDNVRQSALELVLFANVIESLTVDASDCAGADTTVTFNPDMTALMGHSMGAWIAPLVMPYEPRYRGTILSGAGGSWIANLVHKRSPVEVKPFAEAILGYGPQGLEIHEHDPVVNLLQWVGEAADPAVYGRLLVDDPPFGEPRQVLMLQGIVDTYILPPIANATSLSIGLDLAGDALDTDVELLGGPQPLLPLLALVGRGQVDLPVKGNRGAATAVVIQHPEDGIEDGHEVVFQTALPKTQYRCFLESLLKGTPTVCAE